MKGSAIEALAKVPHYLPAPHSQVEFKVRGEYGGNAIVEYFGSTDNLILADIIPADWLQSKRSKQVLTRGTVTRRDDAGGRVFLTFLKYGLVVEFLEALERGLTMPGVTAEIVAAADAEWKECEARWAAIHARDEIFHRPRNSIDRQVGRELGMLAAIVDDDATAEDLIALMPEFKAKLLARKAKRGAERRRPAYLSLVVDNEVRP